MLVNQFDAYMIANHQTLSNSTPETYDVVPTAITPSARRNLADISKVLTQISSGHEFEIPTLASVNAFVATNIPIMVTWFFEGMLQSFNL